MTQCAGVLEGKLPRQEQQPQQQQQQQKQQQRTDTEVLSKARNEKEKRQLVGVRGSSMHLRPSSIINPEERELVAEQRTPQRAVDGQKALNRSKMLSREVSFALDEARDPGNSPDARLSGTEIEGHTKKGDFDDEIDTDTSVASDETTSVFWSSGGGTTTTAADNSSSGGGTPEAGGAVVGGAQRSTSTASIPSTSARHVDLPQLSPPPYETALLRSSGEKPSSAVNGKSFMSLPSALPRTSRSTTVGAKYLKGVAAAAAAALAKKARTRGFSSQHGGKASVTAGASNKTPIDDETSTAVAGANAGGEERRDPDEAATRGRQRGDGGGAQEMGEKLWSGGVRGVRGGLWEQLPPRLTRSPHPAPHHRYTQSAPEARVAGGDIARVSEVGPRARRVVRSLSLCTPTSTSAFWPDLLDVGAPSPAHREKETHPSQRPKGEAEAGGSGRDDEPGIPAPPSPVKVAFSVDPSNPSQRERRRKQGGRDRRCEGESGGAGCIFSPVAINPPGNVWSLARGLSAATPLGPAPSRAEPSWRESDHLEREQAVASAAAGGAAGARGGADGAAVGTVEPSPVGEWLIEDGGFSSPSPSSVWVTRYLDFSTTHGLVFVLSDGSVGILFKDNSKMVIDPTADTFDFTEAPCSPTRVTFPPSPPSSPLPPGEPRVGTERQARGSSGDSPEYPNLSNSAMPTHQYALDYFPFYLRKKCQVLRHFREHVLPDDDRTREGESESAAAAVAEDREEALAFIEKWQKEGDITCIQLSNKTMQVAFGDGTVILLSKDCQSVAVLDVEKETQPHQQAEHRKDVMEERVRQAKDIVVNFLEGRQASEGGPSLADAP